LAEGVDPFTPSGSKEYQKRRKGKESHAARPRRTTPNNPAPIAKRFPLDLVTGSMVAPAREGGHGPER
jgi:hypothetical protein